MSNQKRASLQIASYTLAQWQAWNGILRKGQLANITDAIGDAVRAKIGDGVTNWNSLPYYNPASSSQTLLQTLGFGNTTSGLNIILTNGDKIQSNSGNINFQFGGTGLGEFLDITNVNGGEIYLDATQVYLSADNSGNHSLSVGLTSTDIYQSGDINITSGTRTLLTGQFNLASQTPSRVLMLDGSSRVVSADTLTYPSLTEFSYVKGLTSSAQTQINSKEPTITTGTSSQYWRGDKTFQTLDTLAVSENTNLYFTNARVDSRVQAYTGDVTLSGTAFSIGALKVTNAMLAGSIDKAKITNTAVTLTDTQTLTNKWVQARTSTTASSTTPTINTDTVDFVEITALAAAITSFTTNLSGTPVKGQTLWIAITDNGTARAITWGASFEASGSVALPTTTVVNTRMDIAFIWNDVTSKWRCVGVA